MVLKMRGGDSISLFKLYIRERRVVLPWIVCVRLILLTDNNLKHVRVSYRRSLDN